MVSKQGVFASRHTGYGYVESYRPSGYLWRIVVGFESVDGKAVGNEFRAAYAVFEPACSERLASILFVVGNGNDYGVSFAVGQLLCI